MHHPSQDFGVQWALTRVLRNDYAIRGLQLRLYVFITHPVSNNCGELGDFDQSLDFYKNPVWSSLDLDITTGNFASF